MINLQNIDVNDYFKWILVRYLHPADDHPAQTKTAGKYFAKNLDFKDTKFPIRVKYIHKTEKKNSISIRDFGYENKEKHPIYVSKKCWEEKYIDLLSIGEEGKRHYALIKDFNTFMYNLTWHLRGKHFYHYYLQAFSTEEVLKHHIKYSFKINGKPRIIKLNKGEYVKFRNYEGKAKLSFIPYADFESFLVSEDNGKQNPEESYRNNIENIFLEVMAIN